MKDIQPAHSSLMQFIRRLTTEPGVYRMINEEGTVLYVGKAANLKKRVSSYFNKNQQSAKTQALVNQIARIEVSITRSETEALLLESSFIKSLLPKYNVLMRDDKSYPYIRVSDDKDFPRMELYRSRKKPARGRFFGPYPNVRAVRETLNTIQKLFKIRNCSDSFFNNRSRPCLQYQIKRCTAPCVDYISKEDYQQSVQNAIDFLEGKSGKIIKALEQDMQAASERMAYEEAALLRDQIKNLRVVQEQQGVVRTRGDADVIAINVGRGMACVQCVTIRKGEVTANQAFFPKLPVAEGMGSTAIKLRGPMSRGLSAGSMNLSTSLDPADKPRDVGEENGLNLMAAGPDAPVTIPSAFFLNPLLDQIKITVSAQAYQQLLIENHMQFPETRLKDADHAWLTPVKGINDILAIRQLIKDNLVSQHFVQSVLIIDYAHPVFSKQRCELLKWIPEHDEDWETHFIHRLRQENTTEASLLAAYLTNPNKYSHAYFQHILSEYKSLLKTKANSINGLQELFNQLLKTRQDVFENELSKNPLGQILEPGFRVIFPVPLMS